MVQERTLLSEGNQRKLVEYKQYRCMNDNEFIAFRVERVSVRTTSLPAVWCQSFSSSSPRHVFLSSSLYELPSIRILNVQRVFQRLVGRRNNEEWIRLRSACVAAATLTPRTPLRTSRSLARW